MSFCLIASAGAAFAQAPEIETTIQAPVAPRKAYNRHAITVEALGKGGLYSLNYDYLVSLKSAIGFGISYQSLHANPTVSDAAVELITLPVYANFYFPFANHRPFLSTAVTFLKAHASANVDLSNLFAGMKWTYEPNDGSESKTLTVNRADMALNNNVDILIAIPSLGAGYEFRTADGAIFRLQAMGFVSDKIYPWAGLSFGVGI